VADSKIPMLSLAEAAAAAERLEINPQLAKLNVFRVLLRQPALAKSVSELLLSLLLGKHLDARLRELVIMRLGWATGSEYEWTQHWQIALRIGISEEDVLTVRDWRDSSRLSEADRCVLAATDEVLANGAISEATWNRCAAELGDPDAMLELVGAIGCWRMVSSLLRSIDVPLEDGVVAWPPDGSPGAPTD
jgi:alkylhydroperoxidase family enzyme